MRWAAIAGLAAWLAASAAAADLTGTWMGLMPGRGRRPPQDVAFRLVQEGESLRGKLYGEGLSSPIVEGKVSEGGDVWFVVETREQAGNQINDVRYEFDGVLCQGGIELTRERASARDAVSGVAIPVRRPDDTDQEDRGRRFVSFRLEPLF